MHHFPTADDVRQQNLAHAAIDTALRHFLQDVGFTAPELWHYRAGELAFALEDIIPHGVVYTLATLYFQAIGAGARRPEDRLQQALYGAASEKIRERSQT